MKSTVISLSFPCHKPGFTVISLSQRGGDLPSPARDIPRVAAIPSGGGFFLEVFGSFAGDQLVADLLHFAFREHLNCWWLRGRLLGPLLITYLTQCNGGE